eukprot:289616_1
MCTSKFSSNSQKIPENHRQDSIHSSGKANWSSTSDSPSFSPPTFSLSASSSSSCSSPSSARLRFLEARSACLRVRATVLSCRLRCFASCFSRSFSSFSRS